LLAGALGAVACVGLGIVTAASLVACATAAPPGFEGQASEDGGVDSAAPNTGDGLGQDGVDAGRCEGLECAKARCEAGKSTRLEGRVLDPAGERPVYNAIVYIPNRELSPFEDKVSCDRCGVRVSGSPVAIAITGPDGRFVLDDVPALSELPLVVQVGRFRRQLKVPGPSACATSRLDDDAVRLPRSRSEGDLPRFAVATGFADPFECLLRKIGIDDAEFTAPAEEGRVHLYRADGGVSLRGSALPPATELWGDPARLSRYDVVVLPCEGGPHLETKPPTTQQNLIDYTAKGGRAFITHYGYGWLRGAPSPFDTTGEWALDKPVPDPAVGRVDTTFPKGLALAQWLVEVNASGGAGALSLKGTRNDLQSAKTGTRAWVSVPESSSTQLVSFNTPLLAAPDAQCGRVVYANFHVAESARSGTDFPSNCVAGPLTAQEAALEFMLFDVGACVQPDADPPRPPPR
jgi:hypothetical protein